MVHAQVTVMRSQHGLMTKRIALGGDGKPIADGSACKMSAGTAQTTPAPDAATFAGKIETLSSAEAVGTWLDQRGGRRRHRQCRHRERAGEAHPPHSAAE